MEVNVKPDLRHYRVYRVFSCCVHRTVSLLRSHDRAANYQTYYVSVTDVPIYLFLNFGDCEAKESEKGLLG